MPGEVVSLFCHGTGSGSADNSGNIIDILYRMCKGHKLVLEGPGSAHFHRITGVERQQLPDDIKKDIGIWNKKFPRMRKIMLLEGGITGHGMGSNTGRAYLYLKNMQDGGVDIDTVNLIGWSRGGITCFRIAHYINKYFRPRPEVNIFAIDPVEGENLKAVWGWGKADRRNIPNIVKNLIVTLALDEKRDNFVPSDHQRIQIPGGVNHCFLPFPGRHLTQCYRWLYDYEIKQTNDMYEGTGPGTNEDVLLDVSKIVWQLAYKFLLKQGTQFELNRPNSYQYKAHKTMVRVSVQDLFSLRDDSDMWRLNRYNCIHNNMDFYEHILRTKYQNTGRFGHTKTLKFHRRKIKKGRIWEIVKYPNLFVNDHHMHVYEGYTRRAASGLEPSRRINMKDNKSFGKSTGTIYHIRQGKYNNAHVINWGNLY
jgi:hypothetical protein